MGTVAKGFDLPRCLRAAANIEADLTQLATALTEAQFHAPSRTGGWSIGHSIEHLVLTGRAFVPHWDSALRKTSQNGFHAGSCRYPWWRRRVLDLVEHPSRLKQKAPAACVPCSRHAISETVGRFVAMHQEMARRLAACGRLDAGEAKVQSPFFSWLRYPLGFSFDLVLAHERRHLRQAWLVRRQLLDGR